MKKKSKGNKWEDHYTKQARKDRYVARSVYKLKEIQQKFTIIKKNDKVLDLGCAPGSWLQFAGKAVGKKGQVTGVDLKKVNVTLPEWVSVHTCDIYEMDASVSGDIFNDFNVVLSDMAPSTTGRKDVDAARSFNLCQEALTIAQEKLLPGGNFVCKIFQGAEFKEFTNTVKNNFNKHKIFKPESCRKNSKEIYIIGIGKK